jgi:carbon storage regulator
MLVLSRQADESIVIGNGKDTVRVVVVSIRGDRVRLGIDARAELPVHRHEIWQRIQDETRQGATDDGQPRTSAA